MNERVCRCSQHDVTSPLSNEAAHLCLPSCSFQSSQLLSGSCLHCAMSIADSAVSSIPEWASICNIISNAAIHGGRTYREVHAALAHGHLVPKLATSRLRGGEAALHPCATC